MWHQSDLTMNAFCKQLCIHRYQCSLLTRHTASRSGVTTFDRINLKLARFARACRAERLFALTATAAPKVAEDICEGFGIPSECVVRTGFYRKNLTMLATPITAADRDMALLERLKRHPAGPHNRLRHTTKDVRTSSSVSRLGGTTGTSLSCWNER